MLGSLHNKFDDYDLEYSIENETMHSTQRQPLRLALSLTDFNVVRFNKQAAVLGVKRLMIQWTIDVSPNLLLHPPCR